MRRLQPVGLRDGVRLALVQSCSRSLSRFAMAACFSISQRMATSCGDRKRPRKSEHIGRILTQVKARRPSHRVVFSGAESSATRARPSTRKTDRSKLTYGGALQHGAGHSEAGAMAGAIPRALYRIPLDEAAEMGTPG